MKEATGEVSGTVVTVVILALLIGLGAWLFSTNGPARGWIENIFGKVSNTQVCTQYDANGNCTAWE